MSEEILNLFKIYHNYIDNIMNYGGDFIKQLKY